MPWTRENCRASARDSRRDVLKRALLKGPFLGEPLDRVPKGDVRPYASRLFDVRFGDPFGIHFGTILKPFWYPNLFKIGGPREIFGNPGLGDQERTFLGTMFSRFSEPFSGGGKSVKYTYLQRISTILFPFFDTFPHPVSTMILVSVWGPFLMILAPF